MPDGHIALAMLDETAISTAELRHDPYDLSFVQQAFAERRGSEVLADGPHIPRRDSYSLRDLAMGPRFAAVVQDPLNARFGCLLEHNVPTGLSHRPPCIVRMGNTTGHCNEGYVPPDSRYKIIMVLLGFSREWPYKHGLLRVLRRADRDD